MLGIAQYNLIMYCVFFVFLLVCHVLMGKKKINLPRFFIACVLLQIINNLFLFVIHVDTSYIFRIIIVLDAYLLLSILLNTRALTRFAKNYTIVICIQALLAGIAFFLIFWGLLSPIFVFDEHNRDGLFFGITTALDVFGNVCRVSGFFDEPGALATWGMYALLINKLFFKNKWIEITLIISLLFTFSMAYFIQLALFLILFNLNKLKSLVLLLILLVPPIIIGINSLDQDDFIYKFTVGRFERGDSGELETNRDEMIEQAKPVFFKNPIFGVGEKATWKMGDLDDNPYETLAKDGIVGTFFLYLPFLFILKTSKKREVVFACIILMLGYLQRPLHSNLLQYLMLYVFMLLTYYYYGDKSQNINSDRLL